MTCSRLTAWDLGLGISDSDANTLNTAGSGADMHKPRGKNNSKIPTEWVWWKEINDEQVSTEKSHHRV